MLNTYATGGTYVNANKSMYMPTSKLEIEIRGQVNILALF